MPDTQAQVESITVEAVVIRADGSREDLGVVAAYHRRPWRRLLNKLRGLGRVSPTEE